MKKEKMEMIVPAANPDERMKKSGACRRTLNKKIEKQLCIDASMPERKNLSVYRMLEDTVDCIWKPYSEKRYGFNSQMKHELYYVYLVTEDGKEVLRKDKETFADFSRRVNTYLEKPLFAMQPIIYRHSVPRHKSELLYFDSMFSFLYFTRCRNYSVGIKADNDMIVVDERLRESISDKSREMSDGRKKYRWGDIEIGCLPAVVYKEDHRGLYDEKCAMRAVDYRCFADKECKKKRCESVIKDYIRVLPVCVEVDTDVSYDEDFLRYFPYLMTVLLVNIEENFYHSIEDIACCLRYLDQSKNKKNGDGTKPNKNLQEMSASCSEMFIRGEDEEKRVRRVISAFSIEKAQLSRNVSPEHLYYLVQWVDYFRTVGKMKAKQYNLSERVGEILASVSLADNLNLLVEGMSNKVDPADLLNCLHPNLSPLRSERCSTFFDDCPERKGYYHPNGMTLGDNLCKITTMKYFYPDIKVCVDNWSEVSLADFASGRLGTWADEN